MVLTPTPNSVFQLTNLIDGKFDIAMTAIDNVIAYMEGQGEAKTETKPDLIVFMGGDNGFLSLVSIPEIKTIAELKGRTVSVDALTTGYAFVLFDLLKRSGLSPADYKIEKAGGVLARWEALKEKKHDATMLITPFDIFAEMAGLNVLQYAIDVYGHYQGLIGAARRNGRLAIRSWSRPISVATSLVWISCASPGTRTMPSCSFASICRRCQNKLPCRAMR